MMSKQTMLSSPRDQRETLLRMSEIDLLPLAVGVALSGNDGPSNRDATTFGQQDES